MDPQQLREWGWRHHVSQSRLAQLLGVTPRAIKYWEHGDHDIPPYLRLALERLGQLLDEASRTEGTPIHP